MAALPRRVQAYAFAVAVGAAATALAWIAVWPGGCCAVGTEHLALTGMLTGVIAVALLFPLRLSRSYLLTVDSAAAFAALLLSGPLLAMAAVGAGSAVANAVLAVRGQRDRWNVVFSVGKGVLVVGLTAIPSFGLTGMRAPLPFDRTPSVIAALVGAVVFNVGNSLAVAVAVGLQHGQSPLPIWRQSWRVGATHSQVLLIAGLLTALLAPRYPWAVALLALLMGLTYGSLRQTLGLLERERAARHDAEAAREVAEREARARDEFLSIAAHELRTPITSLRGYAQRLLRRLGGGQPVEGPGAQRALEVIDHQSDKLARLVAQLLDGSRVRAGTLSLTYQPTDLSALGAEVAAAAQQWSPNPVVVHAVPGIVATVDALRLEQVLVNLVDNAIKYSVDQDSPIEMDVLQPSSHLVQIAVRDRGPGIPEEQQRHVFERFYQAGGSRDVGGMGLGLYISRQIVEAHGGTIAVETPPDGGTRFVVTLPAAPMATNDQVLSHEAGANGGAVDPNARAAA